MTKAQQPTQQDPTATLRQAMKDEGVAGTSLEALSWGIFGQESSYGRNTQTSNHGARGAAQILPATFRAVADKGWDIKDPYHNARAGIRYLKQLNETAGGDMRLTAIGYYGGPKAIAAARQGVYYKDRKNPNAPDTNQYASSVLARAGRHYEAMHRNGDALNMSGVSDGSGVPDSGSYDIGDPEGYNPTYEEYEAYMKKMYQDTGVTDRVRLNGRQYADTRHADGQAVSEQAMRLSGASSYAPPSLVKGLQQLANQSPETKEILQGRVPAAPMSIGGRNVVAIPTTRAELDFFTGVQNKPYDEGTKDAIIKGFAQLAPAREQLLGKQVFNTDPTDLDGYLKDIVENV